MDWLKRRGEDDLRRRYRHQAAAASSASREGREDLEAEEGEVPVVPCIPVRCPQCGRDKPATYGRSRNGLIGYHRCQICDMRFRSVDVGRS